MSKQETRGGKISMDTQPVEYKKMYYCTKCHQTMNADNFYKSNNMEKYGANDGYLYECKKCLTMHVDN